MVDEAEVAERFCASCGESFESSSLLRTLCRRCFRRTDRGFSDMREFTRGYDTGWRKGSRFAADELGRAGAGPLVAELVADQSRGWEVLFGELRARIDDAEGERDEARAALDPLQAQIDGLRDQLRAERHARERERDEMREQARAQARAEGALSRQELRDAVILCHPDRHPPERAMLANRITARLLSAIQAGDET